MSGQTYVNGYCVDKYSFEFSDGVKGFSIGERLSSEYLAILESVHSVTVGEIRRDIRRGVN